ncbi:hypothetical protein [Desulfosporosinus sp. BICA1-9]|uniref:hypothetical protein n=1 Tax=Desulfosporosinus sp. BICA1-9 TaxID=1531958 RepID=UPI00054C32A1|nr:hypothetical protein [Desulfosporosinus sp. BICA1-9]HBW39152.1 hypothetical protein [Desulfosporosinus sp.]
MGKAKNGYLKWSSVIATMATTVLALTALITVYLTMSAWKVQQETARPYFILKESPKIDLGNELSFELRFNNVGIHPAVNLSSKTVIFDERLDDKPIYEDESSIVNDIPKETSSSLIVTIPSEEIYPKQLEIKAHFIVIDLQYSDPILNKAYSQTIYMKWTGVKEGQLQPIVHVRVDEKETILGYFQKQKINPKLRN